MIQYSNEIKQTAFQNFLLARFKGNMDEVARIMQTAEHIIPKTLRDYFGSEYNSIYELQEIDEIEEYRRKIKAHPILKSIDIREEPRFTEVLKLYRLWVKNQLNNDEPILTDAENKAQKEESDKKSEDSTRKKLSTIFTEGEDSEILETIYRKRNMELRQACIDYYRSLHHGHIICECCGFEFAAHYDINDDYIEIHHLFPFAHTNGEHVVDATTDLVPLCANCHRMIHHGMGGKGNCMELDELRKKYRGVRYNNI